MKMMKSGRIIPVLSLVLKSSACAAVLVMLLVPGRRAQGQEAGATGAEPVADGSAATVPAPFSDEDAGDDIVWEEAALADGEEAPWAEAVTEGEATQLPPFEPEWVIASPDDMSLAAAYPLASAADAGLWDQALPYALPVSAAAAGADAADLADAESAALADGRTAPWVAAPGGYTGYASGASAAMIAPPSGFSNTPPAFPLGGLGDDLLDGFSLSVSLSGTYDSNPSQGFAGPETSGESDYFLTLGGGLAYASKNSEWTFGATYSGSYSLFFNQSELSGYNQSAGASAHYHGGPLDVTLSLGVGFGSGANRNYASVVEEITYNYGLSARYRLSTKTSLTADIAQNLSSSSGQSRGAPNERSSFDLGIAALWRYSALTEFGPGIRYTSDGGGSQAGRSSIGPTLTVNYKLSRKVSLNSRLGVDFAEYDDGGTTDPAFSMSAGLNYQASRLWGMNLSLLRDTRTDPSTADAFTTVTSLRLGVHRKLRRATLNLGMGYETNTSERSAASSAGGRPDRDYLTLDSSLGMPIFADTTSASLFLRYQDQSGGTQDSWDSMQVGFSLGRSF